MKKFNFLYQLQLLGLTTLILIPNFVLAAAQNGPSYETGLGLQQTYGDGQGYDSVILLCDGLKLPDLQGNSAFQSKVSYNVLTNQMSPPAKTNCSVIIYNGSDTIEAGKFLLELGPTYATVSSIQANDVSFTDVRSGLFLKGKFIVETKQGGYGDPYPLISLNLTN